MCASCQQDNQDLPIPRWCAERPCCTQSRPCASGVLELTICSWIGYSLWPRRKYTSWRTRRWVSGLPAYSWRWTAALLCWQSCRHVLGRNGKNGTFASGMRFPHLAMLIANASSPCAAMLTPMLEHSLAWMSRAMHFSQTAICWVCNMELCERPSVIVMFRPLPVWLGNILLYICYNSIWSEVYVKIAQTVFTSV